MDTGKRMLDTNALSYFLKIVKSVVFIELWRVCPLGRAEVVTSAGAYVNKPGSHGQGRGFDLDAIFWADKNFITLHYPQDRRFYLGVEAILRKHFERFPAPHLSLAGSSLYCICSARL